MSYELKISAKDRAAGRFIGSVKKALLRAAFAEKESSGISQQSIAKKLGVNRSVIHRILKGESNLTLRSVGEIAWALGWNIEFIMRQKGATKYVVDPQLATGSTTSAVIPIHNNTQPIESNVYMTAA